jgi:hypothetical protein
MHGRATVPGPLREPTRELPPVLVPTARGWRRSPHPTSLSYERVKNATRRELADGWGFTAAGLFMIFIGWGIWAAALRGSGVPVWPGVLLSLCAGAAIFVFARFLGYVLLVKVWGRSRRHARWSHFFAGLFLTVVGVLFLINTSWLVNSGDWVHDGWAWLDEQLQRR